MPNNYFTSAHFKLLKEWQGQKRDESNPEQNRAYDELKMAYEITERWAKKVQERFFPEGYLNVRKRPTSQANSFLPYNWAKIYPKKSSPKELAYTVGINANANFIVKIDTVNLGDSEMRREYETIRGQNDDESPIVAVLPAAEGLTKSLSELVEWSIESIEKFSMSYDDVARQLGLMTMSITNKRVHICIGDEKHYADFKSLPVGEAFDWWNVTQSARRGDMVILYIKAPIFAFIATATIDRIDKCPSDSKWKDKPCAWFRDAKMLPQEVTRDQVMQHFPEWQYLKRPVPTCIPNDTTPADLVDRFLALLGVGNQTTKTVKMVDSMEHIYAYYKAKGFFFSKEILTRYFLSLKTKPFVILTGISGTGKTKIAQIFADYICQEETNEEKEKRIAFVPVKPDWMDNKGLLGYYNLLDEKYHVTLVLRLLLEAEQHPDKPYFIILDEMNLAKVEQYFSDFLSIMESRTQDKPQGEALHLHSAGNVQAQDDKTDVPASFHIPVNVYFTGTVNIDESTYMFSSKVLDRANVIEFNDVNLADYENYNDSSGRFVLKDADVRNCLQPVENEVPFSSKSDYSAALKITPELHSYLDECLNILRQYHLHFGYRVINEISHFIRNAHEQIQNFDLEEVMDIQILQKILPKFHGTQGKLEEPLNKLLAFCYDETISFDASYLEKAAAYDEDARFPRSAQKLSRMIRNLNVQGYTSFIE